MAGEQMQDMITAGMDTTAISVEWAMAELVRSPHVQLKAQEELDEVRKPCDFSLLSIVVTLTFSISLFYLETGSGYQVILIFDIL